MPEDELEIQVYLREDGEAPFTGWLDSLKDRRAVAKIRVRLARVRLGNIGQHRSVGRGVSEMKVDFGPGYRVYIGQTGEKVVILCGGDKDTQAKDIRMAQDYWADYRRRSRETK